MKNLKDVIYNKILIQAEEARELGFDKLAEDVLSVMGPISRTDDEQITYSSAEISKDVHQKLWKIAMDYIKFHDVDSVDIQKIDETLKDLGKTISKNIENALGTSNIGKIEPKLPGQK